MEEKKPRPWWLLVLALLLALALALALSDVGGVSNLTYSAG